MEKTTEHYHLSDNESKAINIAKAFFSILVVFVHVYGESIWVFGNEEKLINPWWLEIIKITISKTIAGSAVPAFFVISAVLLYRKEFVWKDNIKKKCKSLLIPYLILNAFWIIFDSIPFSLEGIHRYLHEGSYLLSWGVKDWEEAFIGIYSGYPCLYPLWYVRELLVLNILASIIKKLIDKLPEISLGVITALYLFINTKFVITCDGDGVYNHNLTALFYWCIGYFLVKYQIHLDSFLKKFNIVALSISYIALISVSTFISHKEYDYLFTVIRICIIVGVFFWFKVAFEIKSAKSIKSLLYLSSFSFSIYIFHEKALTYFRQIGILVLPNNSIFTSLLMYFLVPIIIICCCIVLSIFMKRFAPRFYSVITGSRTTINR